MLRSNPKYGQGNSNVIPINILRTHRPYQLVHNQDLNTVHRRHKYNVFVAGFTEGRNKQETPSMNKQAVLVYLLFFF